MALTTKRSRSSLTRHVAVAAAAVALLLLAVAAALAAAVAGVAAAERATALHAVAGNVAHLAALEQKV